MTRTNFFERRRGTPSGGMGAIRHAHMPRERGGDEYVRRS
jgi:hypothetical protein